MTISNAQNTKKQNNTFESYFSSLQDPRRTTKGHYYYPLHEILLLVLSSVLCGFKDWTSIELFGNTKLDWLRRFYPFEHGIPSHDVLGKLFSRMDTACFNECFINWVNQVSKITEGAVIAIDGKTICGSGSSDRPKSAIHMLSAYATQSRLCLAQTAVSSKSNEITAIPLLLDLLTIKGCIVTIDAMGCQKDIAKKIINQKGDYVLAVKENQKELFDQVTKMFSLHKPDSLDQTVDAGHGRIETRTCGAISNLTFFDDAHLWCGLKSVVRVNAHRYIKKTGAASDETRYYITSLPANAEKLNKSIRAHWAIENNLHWALDVIMDEDKSLKKKDHSAANFNIVNKIALFILEHDKTPKLTKPMKKAKAALDDDFREKIIKS